MKRAAFLFKIGTALSRFEETTKNYYSRSPIYRAKHLSPSILEVVGLTIKLASLKTTIQERLPFHNMFSVQSVNWSCKLQLGSMSCIFRSVRKELRDSRFKVWVVDVVCTESQFLNIHRFSDPLWTLASARGPILPPPNHPSLKNVHFPSIFASTLLYLLSEIGNFNFILDDLPVVLRTCRLVVRVALTPRAHLLFKPVKLMLIISQKLIKLVGGKGGPLTPLHAAGIRNIRGEYNGIRQWE
eukprot:sb/3469013/